MPRILTRVVALIVLSVVVSPSTAQENVYKKAIKSTVWILQPAEMMKLRTGSGSLIDVKQRLVLTNYHVVGNLPEAMVLFPIIDKKGTLVPEREKYFEQFRMGAAIPAKVIHKDSSKDLALLQLATLPPGAPALRLAKESPGPGDRVHSIGSPGASGALFNYTDGSVKSVYHKKFKTGSKPNDPNGFEVDATIIETSSLTNKGDSGGPLMNDKAELVGVTQGFMAGDDTTRSISYFIDLSEVRSLLAAKKITISTPAATTASTDTPKPMTPTPMPKVDDKAKREEAAASKLELAKALASTKPEKAAERYRDIIKQFPETKAAEEAKKLLEKP